MRINLSAKYKKASILSRYFDRYQFSIFGDQLSVNPNYKFPALTVNR